LIGPLNQLRADERAINHSSVLCAAMRALVYGRAFRQRQGGGCNYRPPYIDYSYRLQL
jgi:hypothetical protein